MPRNHVLGIPGQRSERQAIPRKILRDSSSGKWHPGGVFVDGIKTRDIDNVGDEDILQGGLLMGRITASELYRNAIVGVTDTLHDTSATPDAMTLPAALVTELSRLFLQGETDFKITGPPTLAGTVVTEDITIVAITDATTIDITGTDTTADFAVGSLIRPDDGSQNIKGVSSEVFGKRVTDIDSDDITVQLPELLIGGIIYAAVIVGYTAMDASVQAFVKAGLLADTLFFTFDDDF